MRCVCGRRTAAQQELEGPHVDLAAGHLDLEAELRGVHQLVPLEQAGGDVGEDGEAGDVDLERARGVVDVRFMGDSTAGRDEFGDEATRLRTIDSIRFARSSEAGVRSIPLFRMST